MVIDQPSCEDHKCVSRKASKTWDVAGQDKTRQERRDVSVCVSERARTDKAKGQVCIRNPPSSPLALRSTNVRPM